MILSLQNFCFIANLCHKNTVVIACVGFVFTPCVDLENSALFQLIMDVQHLTFQSLGVVADGEFPGDMAPVELRRKQIADPLEIPGVVHVSVPIQIGEQDLTGGFAFQRLDGK